jgi:TP53 regulating kinase-like protein
LALRAIFMLIKKGAEANLYVEDWYGLTVIKKARIRKTYRLRQIDHEIRRSRTVHEAQILHDAKRAGVLTPMIYFIDVNHAFIIMEYVKGPRVKELLSTLPRAYRQRLCRHIGGLIGRLHRRGIIHGDLTTSNMIQRANERVFFIDFGLAEYSMEVEKRGVDLHLLKRALESTHYAHAAECFNALMEGYSREVGNKTSEDVITRVGAIAKRGRYSVK